MDTTKYTIGPTLLSYIAQALGRVPVLTGMEEFYLSEQGLDCRKPAAYGRK